MKLKALFASAVLAALTISTAHATTIDFENIAIGTVLPAAYAIGDLTFSSPTGLLVTDIGTGNGLCSTAGNGCTSAIGFTFETGAKLFQFTFSGDVDASTQYIFDVNATVVFQGEVLPIHLTGIAFADGNPLNQQLVQFENPNITIMSMGFYSLDDTPFVIDNISYTPGVSPVPEPSSWAMLMAGLGLTGVALRRRSKHAVLAERVSLA